VKRCSAEGVSVGDGNRNAVIVFGAGLFLDPRNVCTRIFGDRKTCGGEGPGGVNSGKYLQRLAAVDQAIPLDDMQFFVVRRREAVGPGLVVEPDGVDDERVAS
jgi:hypothetical protein